MFCPKCGSDNIGTESDDGKIGSEGYTTFIAEDDGSSVEYYGDVYLISCNDCSEDTIIGN